MRRPTADGPAASEPHHLNGFRSANQSVEGVTMDSHRSAQNDDGNVLVAKVEFAVADPDAVGCSRSLSLRFS
jgi:hypothetical protein